MGAIYGAKNHIAEPCGPLNLGVPYVSVKALFLIAHIHSRELVCMIDKRDT